jgi:hypothetical protein
LPAFSVDLALIEVNMHDIGCLAATRGVVQADPELRVRAVTALNDRPLPKLLEAGARGCGVRMCRQPSARLRPVQAKCALSVARIVLHLTVS